ncbi:phosphohydrolase [Paraburkholderia sp. J7]|uniref:phosphohydrolase n=1 Tax=Paraburkholderia sp. J7 TaxID=2805438 RepID=UPI002AB63853|nr:phosphohydrolase [Paraburkholderia sp. J7]
MAADLLFVAAHFAHMGLSSSYANSTQRYELDGADAAKEFLDREGVRHAHSAAVWDAISLHTTPGVPERMCGLTRLLAYGLRADLFGEGIDCLSVEQRSEILTEFPRGDNFANSYLEAVGRGIAHRPETTFGAVSADILERYSSAFYRGNFCGRVLGSRWETGSFGS